MVKNGHCEPGALTKFLPPLSAGNALAIRLWNNLGGELRWPDLHYELEFAHVEDVGLMLDRLRVIQEAMRS